MKKNKNRLFVLKESSHNETIFEQNFLTEGSDRSWPRGLRLNMQLAGLEGGSRDDKQWIRLRTLLNRSLSEASINTSILKLKSVVCHLEPFLNIELILERL